MICNPLLPADHSPFLNFHSRGCCFGIHSQLQPFTLDGVLRHPTHDPEPAGLVGFEGRLIGLASGKAGGQHPGHRIHERGSTTFQRDLLPLNHDYKTVGRA